MSVADDVEVIERMALVDRAEKRECAPSPPGADRIETDDVLGLLPVVLVTGTK